MKTVRAARKKILRKIEKITEVTEIPRIGADDLFSFFTANIIKKRVTFTR